MNYIKLVCLFHNFRYVKAFPHLRVLYFCPLHRVFHKFPLALPLLLNPLLHKGLHQYFPLPVLPSKGTQPFPTVRSALEVSLHAIGDNIATFISKTPFYCDYCCKTTPITQTLIILFYNILHVLYN